MGRRKSVRTAAASGHARAPSVQHGDGAWRAGGESLIQSCIAIRALQKQYNSGMKTATIPPVRIEPSFRQDIENALAAGESLAALVETAVRNEVTRRQVQSEFVRRGMLAIERTAVAGDGVPAEAVIARLRSKLAAAKVTKPA